MRTQTPRRKITARIKREAAGFVAEYLQRLAHPNEVNDPATWRRVAKRLRVDWHDFNDHSLGRGLYIVTETGRPVIAINAAFSQQEQIRAWIHELAHHVFNTWVPPQLSDAADVYCYEGDISDIRHKIARDVEGLVLR